MLRIILAALVLALPIIGHAQQPLATASTWGGQGLLSSDALYYREGAVVHLEGLVYKFTGSPSSCFFCTYQANNELVATLPEGYRPTQYQYLRVWANSTYGPDQSAIIAISPSGEIRVTFAFGYFGYLSLAGVSFRAQ